MTTLYRNSHKLYIWMCGDNSIGLVNPVDFQCDLIANFFGSSNDRINPFTIIASDRMKKAVGVYVHEKQGAFVYLGAQGLTRLYQSKLFVSGRRDIIQAITCCVLRHHWTTVCCLPEVLHKKTSQKDMQRYLLSHSTNT